MTLAVPDFDLAAVRAQIPSAGTRVSLANCSQGPQSLGARAAAMEFMDSWDTVGMDWDGWVNEVERARAAFARLIGASPEDVAVFSSVSHAASAVASALNLAPERNRIVATDDQFPGVGQVWTARCARGGELIRVDSDGDAVEALRKVVDSTTALISVAHGDYLSGARADLRAALTAARDCGAHLFVDAYQTLGNTPIDVAELDVDFLAAGTLKYLMGTAGIAFLYVRPTIAPLMRPEVTGWFGRAHPFAFDPWTLDWAEGARRFDGGTPPILPAFVARPGIEWVCDIGVEKIDAWTEVLSARIMDAGTQAGLKILGPPDVRRRTPVVAFISGVDSGRVEHAMRARGILVSARGPVVRVAPHFFNTVEEADSTVAALTEVIESMRGAAPE